MKRQRLTKAIGIVLSAVMMFTSVPVSAAGTAEDSGVPVTTDEFDMDFKNMTDEEVSKQLCYYGDRQEEIAQWLADLNYEDYTQLIARDTYLTSKATTVEYDVETDEDGEIVETTVTDSYETPYYEYLLESNGLTAPVKDSRFAKQTATYFANTSGKFYIEYQRNGIKVASITVQIGNLSKTKNISVKTGGQHSGISVTYPDSPAGLPTGFSTAPNITGTLTSHKNDDGSAYSCLWLATTVTNSRNYQWAFSIKDYQTKEFTMEGTTIKINIAKNAGVGTDSKPKETKNAIGVINITVPEYTVTYKGNGATNGSVADAVYKADDTSAFTLAQNGFTKKSTLTLDTGASIGAAEPKSTDYYHTFNGWSEDSNAESGAAEKSLYTPGKNTTFYATWKKPSVTLPTPAEKEHYNFIGWTLTKDAEKDDPVRMAGYSFDMSEDTTYYAQWEHKIANYTCYHYVQKEAGKTDKETDYELVDTTGEKDLEDGTVKSLNYSQKAIDAANNMAEGYECDLPQMQVVTLPEGNSEFYYYYNLKTSYVEYTVNHYVQKEAGKDDRESGEDYELVETTSDKGQAGSMIALPFSVKAISAANNRQEGYQCILPTEQKVTLVKGKDHTYNYYYDIGTNVVSYTIYHYVQKEPGKTNKETDYELADTTYGSGEVGESVTLPYSKVAAELADSVTGYECSYPQSVQTTLKAGQTAYYYYYDLKAKNASGGNTNIDNSKTFNYFNDYGLSEEQVKDIVNNIEKNGTATFTIDGVKYTIVRNADGTFSITFMVTDKNGSLTVPSYIKLGDKVYTINNIADNAFKGNKTIKSVVISNGITTIGNYAFYGCTNLETVYMPNTILKVGRFAFAKCTKLKKVRMSGNCYELGKGVFSDDKALTKITLGSKLTKVPDSAFKNCKKLKSIQIPKNVTTIGKQAFYGCTGLKTVKIKTPVLKKVGSKAFKKTTEKIKIKVPKSKMEAYTKLLKGKYGK